MPDSRSLSVAGRHGDCPSLRPDRTGTDHHSMDWRISLWVDTEKSFCARFCSRCSGTHGRHHPKMSKTPAFSLRPAYRRFSTKTSPTRSHPCGACRFARPGGTDFRCQPAPAAIAGIWQNRTRRSQKSVSERQACRLLRGTCNVDSPGTGS